jgi:hypothetical protein
MRRPVIRSGKALYLRSTNSAMIIGKEHHSPSLKGTHIGTEERHAIVGKCRRSKKSASPERRDSIHFCNFWTAIFHPKP